MQASMSELLKSLVYFLWNSGPLAFSAAIISGLFLYKMDDFFPTLGEPDTIYFRPFLLIVFTLGLIFFLAISIKAARRQIVLFKSRKQMRATLKDLDPASKDILLGFFQENLQTMNLGYDEPIAVLVDKGILYLGDTRGGSCRCRIETEYYDLLEKDGWELLYEGNRKPSISSDILDQPRGGIPFDV